MTFKEAAMYYYNTFDMNCAEAILHGANDVLNLDLKDEDYKLLGAFGAGCGCGSLCATSQSNDRQELSTCYEVSNRTAIRGGDTDERTNRQHAAFLYP